ncbi:uncharacterized protein C24B11.05 [Lathyrus oleraceus]|uniref:uncharacterized protein C24B11.05 n=1 Tax=Pisum sativum TaxID=3888 RepID=UPI0021CFE154|nr:uncharacterized protein C24B11.05-like [Pisum sativum]
MVYCIVYMLQKLGMEAEKVPELCNSLYKTYGTTMAALRLSFCRAIGYDFDYNDFHSYVHGRLPYSLLKPDRVLKRILQSLPCRKVGFTNADTGHAIRVLKRLGLEDCFERIISFDTLNSLDDIRPPDDKNDEEIFDFWKYTRRPDSDMVLPKTRVICTPFDNAFEEVFKLADIDPQRTVREIFLPSLIHMRTLALFLFFRHVIVTNNILFSFY